MGSNYWRIASFRMSNFYFTNVLIIKGFKEIIVYVILQKRIIVKVKAEVIFLQEQWAFAVDALE